MIGATPRRPSPRTRPRAFIEAGGMSTADVARVLGASRQAVSELELKALRKLRRALAERGISARDLF